MASHRAILGVLQAIQEQLERRIEALTRTRPSVLLLGSSQLATAPTPSTEALGIYLHRVAVDPFSRNRHLPPQPGLFAPRPELPVNLHFLLVGWSGQTGSEIGLLAAAMQVIGSALILDASHLVLADASWSDRESVQVIPEEMSTEDLMRIWDSLPGDYRLSIPYLVKTLRLAPDTDPEEHPLVQTLVYGGGQR